MSANRPSTLSRARRTSFLPFSPPDIGEAEITAVVDTLRSGWLTTGPQTRRFEREFADYLGAPDALAVNSCTAALHLALLVLNIGPGDEVITTPMTFCSTAHVIEHVGARPVLVDVAPDTLNLDPACVAAALTPATRALLPVHYAGHPVEMQPLRELAKAHGLSIVEDAAHALPASYQGQRVGASGSLTAFSFYATKNLTTGEGGMLTGDPALVERARTLSLHGMSRDAWKRYGQGGSWYYEVVAEGYKYNMTDIQAALGLVQLARLAVLQDRRRTIVARYHAAFDGVEALQPPAVRPDVEPAWHLYVLRLHLDRLTIDRAGFIEQLAARNIGSSVHFIPLHLHPFYRDKYGWSPGDFPVASEEYQRLLSLPLNSTLTDDDVDDVIAAVLEIVAIFQR